MRDGRRFGAPPKPHQPPPIPAGKVNVTDPDSRNVKTPRGYMQGYNAQAAVNERQIVVAAEINPDSLDFGHLEPMVDAARQELAAAGITDTPSWSPMPATGTRPRWNRSSVKASKCSSRPMRANAKAPDQAGTAAPTPSCVVCSRPLWATRFTENAKSRSSRCSPTQVQPPHGPLPTPRQIRLPSEWRLIAATHNLVKLHGNHTALAAV
jgi:hypothetical protein